MVSAPLLTEVAGVFMLTFLSVQFLLVVEMVGELLEIAVQDVVLHAQVHQLVVVFAKDWCRVGAVYVVVLSLVENALVNFSEVRQRVDRAALSL